MSESAFSKHKVRNDIIFISALVLISALVGLGFYLFRTGGDTVRVTVNGELYGEFSLDEDRTFEIISDGGYNVLVIKDGKAYVESASCPDGICAAHKPISRSGESIVCLPNKVVITAKAQNDGDAPDIVA